MEYIMEYIINLIQKRNTKSEYETKREYETSKSDLFQELLEQQRQPLIYILWWN